MYHRFVALDAEIAGLIQKWSFADVVGSLARFAYNNYMQTAYLDLNALFEKYDGNKHGSAMDRRIEDGPHLGYSMPPRWQRARSRYWFRWQMAMDRSMHPAVLTAQAIDDFDPFDSRAPHVWAQWAIVCSRAGIVFA